MESTRDQILRLVRGRREATVAQLAESLDLSLQAVRRHLDGLRADGLLDVRIERRGVGRPALVFFATERGEEGRSYLQLLSRVVRQLDKMDAAQTAGVVERKVIERVFTGVAEDLVAEHKGEVLGTTLDQRVAEASRALEREGIVDSWSKQDDAFQVINGECPYLRLASMTTAPCNADLHAIELLIGASVQQTKRIVDGSPTCEYIIRPSIEEKEPQT